MLPWVLLAAAGLVIVASRRQAAVLRQSLRVRPASSEEADRQTCLRELRGRSPRRRTSYAAPRLEAAGVMTTDQVGA